MKKTVRFGLLFYVLWTALSVHAANILYLSTLEQRPPASSDGTAWDNAAYNSVLAASPPDSVVDGRGWLSNPSPIDAAVLEDIELTVITTTFGLIDPVQLPVLENILQSRNDMALVIFSDGCCGEESNLNPIVNMVSDATGWTLGTTGRIGGAIQSALNTDSMYQADFADVNPMRGTAYRLITNVPSDYLLYRGAASAPADSAYGLFVPHALMNAGNGACVFLTADVSPLGPDADADGTQAPRIMQAFLAAALDPNGACAKPAAGIPDLAVELTGPAAPTQGTPTAYQVTVRNVGPEVAEATTVEVTLPAGFTLQTGALPGACTASGDGQSFSCSVPALAAVDVDTGAVASAVFGFQLVARAGATLGDMLAVVSASSTEVNLSNNTSRLPVSVTIPPVVNPPASALTPVPVLGFGALALMSALVGGLGIARRRKINH